MRSHEKRYTHKNLHKTKARGKKNSRKLVHPVLLSHYASNTIQHKMRVYAKRFQNQREEKRQNRKRFTFYLHNARSLFFLVAIHVILYARILSSIVATVFVFFQNTRGKIVRFFLLLAFSFLLYKCRPS